MSSISVDSHLKCLLLLNCSPNFFNFSYFHKYKRIEELGHLHIKPVDKSAITKHLFGARLSTLDQLANKI